MVFPTSTQTRKGLRLLIYPQFLTIKGNCSLLCKNIITKCHRNYLFIQFPGRDLGGILTFLKGFRNETWVACAIFVFIIPAFLYGFYLIFRFYGIEETLCYNYWWNVLIMISGLAQQVDFILHIITYYT